MFLRHLQSDGDPVIAAQFERVVVKTDATARFSFPSSGYCCLTTAGTTLTRVALMPKGRHHGRWHINMLNHPTKVFASSLGTERRTPACKAARTIEQLGRSFKTNTTVHSAICCYTTIVASGCMVGYRKMLDIHHHSWEHPKSRRYRNRRVSLIDLASGLPGTIPCLENSCAAKTAQSRVARD